jgi:hypothetical protein
MSIHEQAHAEAERIYPKRSEHTAWIDSQRRIAYERGYRSGHEAATRTHLVTTVTELDALPVGSAIRTTDDAIWQQFRGSGGRIVWRSAVWAGAYTSTDLDDYGGGLLPARVLYEPEETR